MKKITLDVIQNSASKVKERSVPQEVLNRYFIESVENEDVMSEIFLDLGADPNVFNNAAMKAAVDKGNLERVKMLQGYGAEINVYLGYAIRGNYYDTVEYLLSQGVKVDEGYIRTAIKAHNIDMFDLLLKYSTVLSFDGYAMQNAATTDLYFLKEILNYTNQRFLKGTFEDEESEWGKLIVLPADVLKFVLECKENSPEMFSEISPNNFETEFGRYLYLTLKKAVFYANRREIDIIIDYVTRNPGNTAGWPLHLIDFDEISSRCNSAEDINYILRLSKENEVFRKYIRDKKVRISDFKNVNMETLKLLGISLNNEILKQAIKEKKKDLVEQILLNGVEPQEDDIYLAAEIYSLESSYSSETGKNCKEILRMLFKKIE